MVYLRSASASAIEMLGGMEAQIASGVAGFLAKLDVVYREAQEVFPVLQQPEIVTDSLFGIGKGDETSATRGNTSVALGEVLEGLSLKRPHQSAKTAKEQKIISKQELEIARSRKQMQLRSRRIRGAEAAEVDVGGQLLRSLGSSAPEEEERSNRSSTTAHAFSEGHCTLDYIPEQEELRAEMPVKAKFRRSDSATAARLDKLEEVTLEDAETCERTMICLWQPQVHAFELQVKTMHLF
eukprot:g17352.t1